MKCDLCKRALADGEPIYRASTCSSDPRFHYHTVAHVCANCAPQWDHVSPSIGRILSYHFRSSPKPCGKCGRPVFQTLQRREPEIIACSPACRKAQHNARAIAQMKRLRGERKCECGKMIFPPTRSDARFCSNACRQKAYRARQVQV
jgi:hypothetical protein